MGRELIFYEDYFLDFYLKQIMKGQEKIEFVVNVIRTVDRVAEKFLRHIAGTDGIYEMRIKRVIEPKSLVDSIMKAHEAAYGLYQQSQQKRISRNSRTIWRFYFW